MKKVVLSNYRVVDDGNDFLVDMTIFVGDKNSPIKIVLPNLSYHVTLMHFIYETFFEVSLPTKVSPDFQLISFDRELRDMTVAQLMPLRSKFLKTFKNFEL